MSNQTFLKTVFVLLFLISLMGCNFSSNKNVNNSSNSQNTDTGNPDNTKPSEIIEEGESQSIIRVPQYFWGTWQRMDNGQYYVIDENEVTFKNQNYVITSSTESSLNVNNLGVFEKQSDSVMVNNSIPYFRKGGTNLEYTMKLVGFEDDISRAAGSLNLSDFKVKGKSEKYKSFESDSNVSEDGTIKLIAPTAGDIQTITVSSESDVVAVVPGITVETKDSNMGTIPISSKGQYSLKVTGTIPDEEKDDGYLYGNNYKSYPMTITITNISEVDSSPSVCSLTAEDSRVTISSLDGSDINDGILISTLKSGFTKSITVYISCGSISESYIDTGLLVSIKNAVTERTWQDYIPLRFFCGLVPITIAAESVENNQNAALNGFVISPDGNSQFFSVLQNSIKTIYVPSFQNTEQYTLAFSGATVEGNMSNSTEMLYTVASGTWIKKDVNQSGNAFISAVQYGEVGLGNENELTALNAEKSFEAYLSEGDIDFYLINMDYQNYVLPDYSNDYLISFFDENNELKNEIEVPIGTLLSSESFPDTERIGYTFKGWYSGNLKIEEGYIVTQNLQLIPYWDCNEYEITYVLNDGKNSNENPLSFFYEEKEDSFVCLNEPSKYGYYFEGWYDNSLFLNEPITKINKNTTENIVLYAKWDKILFDVTSSNIEDLDLTEIKYRSTISVTDDIDESFLILLAEKIKNATADIVLDLSNATGITEINRFRDSSANYSIFKDCNKLKKIIFPNCLELIGNYAFVSCYELEEVIIPDSVTTIGCYSFAYCKNLYTVKFSKNITKIGYSCFCSCWNLEEIIIPENVTVLESSTFSGCEKLENVILNEKLMEIENHVFQGCKNLREIIIPASVQRIRYSVFYGCTNLSSVVFQDYNNWNRSSNSTYSGGIMTSVGNPIEMAREMKSNDYSNYCWYKN